MSRTHIFAIVFLFSIWPLLTEAQSAYKGGRGDGYDMAEVTQFNVDVEEAEVIMDEITLHPTVLAEGEAFQLNLPDKIKAFDQLAIRIVTVDGKALKRFTFGKDKTSYKLKAPEQPGIYFVAIRLADSRKVVKLAVN